MMTDDEIFCAVVEVLEASAIPYMLVGSFTTNYYGTSALLDEVRKSVADI